MHKIDHEWVANLLRHAGIKWTGPMGIDAAGVKQTITELTRLAKEQMNSNGVTAESGGILIKAESDGHVSVYVALGEAGES